MQITERLSRFMGRKNVRYGAVLVIIIIIVGILASRNGAEVVVDEPVLPLVEVITPTEYAGGQTLSLIGSVRAFTEANVTAERPGRVTAVNVSLGQTVQAGQVIATLENAAERAAVLQAEGVYDAAVANAAQSTVSVSEAENALRTSENGAVSTFKSAYNTTNGIVLNTIDQFFSNPNSTIPGLRIDGRGFTSELNAERVAFQSILPEWKTRTNTITVDSDLKAELDYAEGIIQRTIDMVDTFIVIFNQQDGSTRYSEAELASFSSQFTGLRSNLIALQSSIDAARSSLDAAADGVRRAELGAVGGTNSAADAQVKQALGSLRAAQANLAKTILRSPISGTVNSLSVRTGDFLNSFETVAQVANNNALEIVTYVSDTERDLITTGDLVVIEGAYEGRVAQIAPAVDPQTRKIEVRIATENTDINNGDTVRVTKEVAAASTRTIIIPITAVKFEIEDGFVFLVEEGALVSRQVSLGVVRGGSVEVIDGLAADESFVVDARGLQVGESVTVAE